MLHDDLLSVLNETPSGSLGFSVAWTRLNLKRGQALPRSDFEAAVERLTADRKITQTPGSDETRLELMGRSQARVATQPEPRLEGTASDLVDQSNVPESSLMQPLLSWISAIHAPTYCAQLGDHPTFVVSDTSKSGGASGIWSRPDVTVAAVRKHRFASARYVELTGYELKRAGEGTVVAVHEALAHKRWVHRAYLVLFTPRGQDNVDDIEGLKSECARHGIELVTFAHINDHAQYREALQARKDNVDPALVDDFILKRMDSSAADLERLMGQ